MRLALVLGAVAALAADASADAKLDQAIAGYEKEAASCRMHEGGIAKVLAGVTSMLQTSHDDALVVDARTLRTAHEAVAAYCDELDAALAVLRADPAATYKAVEKQLDEHDNRIRPLRRPAQQAIDDAEPLVARLIPRINAARDAAAGKQPAKLPTTFPSGHKVKLPALPGTWKLSGTRTSDTADYTEGTASLSLHVHSFTGATCEQQLRLTEMRADQVSVDRSEPKGERPATTLAWHRGTAWRASYTLEARTVQVECIPTKTGGLVVTLDQPDKLEPARDLSDVAAQMLAAHTVK